jgi:hypothetical protein
MTRKLKGFDLIRVAVVVLTLIFVVSCGGGGGSDGDSSIPPPTSSLGGIWEGAFSSNVVPFNAQMVGLISEDREVRFISDDGVQTFGTVSVSGNTASGNLTSIAPSGYKFVDGSQIGTIVINGSVAEKLSLSGTYSGTGDQGTFSLQYNSLYDRDSALPLLQGTWNMAFLDNMFVDLTIDIQADGTFTGYDNRGYTYEGDITIINPEYNCYRVSVIVTDPGNNTFVYSGLLALGDNNGVNDLLYFGVDYNKIESIAGTFLKQ